MNVGVCSYDQALDLPGDRRRFLGFAARHGLNLQDAWTLGNKPDFYLVTLGGDLSRWDELRSNETPIIVDTVDTYLNERTFSARRLLRGPYKYLIRKNRNLIWNYTNHLQKVFSEADCVVCASEEQREILSALNQNVQVVGDCLDEIGSVIRTRNRESLIKIVWEGYPENLKHFGILKDPLSRLAEEFRIELVVVTATGKSVSRRIDLLRFLLKFKQSAVKVAIREWSGESLQEECGSADLALIPIDIRDQMAWFKPENKLVSFWRMGVPVLASATPSYKRIAKSVGLEWAITPDSDWYERIREILLSREIFDERTRVGQTFSLESSSSVAIDNLWWGAIRSIKAV